MRSCKFLPSTDCDQEKSANLQIEDIDWRTEVVRVRHSKTQTCSFLPLMEPVGEAVLGYLHFGRHATDTREILIRTRAPYRKLEKIYNLVRQRLRNAGIKPPGKCGPTSSVMRVRSRCCARQFRKRFKARQIVVNDRGSESGQRAIMAAPPQSWKPCKTWPYKVRLFMLRRFGSVLGAVMADRVTLMRNRGYKYTSQSAGLLRFDHFLQLNPALQDQPIGVMLGHWAAAKTTPITLPNAKSSGYPRENLAPPGPIDPAAPTGPETAEGRG